MRRFFGFLLCVACSSPPAKPVIPVLAPAEPMPERAAFDVGPEELGNDAAIARIRHRVRLAYLGTARLLYDAKPFHIEDDDAKLSKSEPSDRILPVLDVSGNRFQVAVEDDDARIAVWIEARDTWETTIRTTRMRFTERGESGLAGVWLEAGAPLTLQQAIGGWREAKLRNDRLAIEGRVETPHTGRVYVTQPNDTKHHQMNGEWVTDKLPDPPGRAASVDEQTIIYLTPDETQPIATLRVDHRIGVVTEAKAGWSEIEFSEPYVRVRGFVHAAAVVPLEEPGELHTLGSSGGFGMSHADRIDVPKGTCLHSSAGGPYVGVTIDKRVRLGQRKLDEVNWSMIYITTPWGHTEFFIEDTGSDPANPQWAACTGSPH